jgi:RHS repeat-associated protein
MENDYEYDAEGNRTAKETIATGEREEYTWDHRNRLVTIKFKNSSGTVIKQVDQTYDVFNQWIKRSIDPDGATGSATVVDTYFSHLDGQIVAQFDGDDESDLSHRYLWNPTAVDQLLADETVTSLSSAGTVLYPFGDHLGTLRDLATYNDSTNVTTIANHRRYDSFGNLISETNASIDEFFAFTGRPFDDSTSLQNNLNRWYDSKTGSWMSEDPISFVASDSNLHRYAGNNVTRGSDPTGLILQVDGAGVTKGSAVYNSLATSPLAREILDTLIGSKSTYKYSLEQIKRLIAGREAIVQAVHNMAERLRKGQLVFGEKMLLTDRKETRASELLSNILAQEKIETECYNAVEWTYFLALRIWLNRTAFDRLYLNLEKKYDKSLFPVPYINQQYGYDPDSPVQILPDGSYAFRLELLPGDWVNILNPGADSPWHNENAIYLGKDEAGKLIFFGHPFGVGPLQMFLDRLSAEYVKQGKPGMPKPYLGALRICIDFESNFSTSQEQ